MTLWKRKDHIVATNNAPSKRIAFNFCKHAMAARFADFSEYACVVLLIFEEKNAESITKRNLKKRNLISE